MGKPVAWEIPFHRPPKVSGTLAALERVVQYTGAAPQHEAPMANRCRQLLQQAGFRLPLLTQSCTAALELAALQLPPQTVVAVPSFTHPATANAFLRVGCLVRWVECRPAEPMPGVADYLQFPEARVWVVVHYGGQAPADFAAIRAAATRQNVRLVEDAAHAFGSSWEKQPLGTFGALGAFSFHRTKHIAAGEAGFLSVNRPEWYTELQQRQHHGTDRARFQEGYVEAYQALRVGGAFAPAELTLAVLQAQLRSAPALLSERRRQWQHYQALFAARSWPAHLLWPAPEHLPAALHANGHVFWLKLANRTQREALRSFLAERSIQAAFHYTALHSSPLGQRVHPRAHCPNARNWSYCLLRLPLYQGLTPEEQARVVAACHEFFAEPGK